MVVGLTDEMLEIGQEVPGVRSQLPIAATVEEARASLQLGGADSAQRQGEIAGVVPIVGNWRRAVYFADKLAVGESCEVHLVDLIKVPRTLPIGSPLPEREAAGQERLEEAQELVRKTGLKSFTHVERVRSEAGLDDFASAAARGFLRGKHRPRSQRRATHGRGRGALRCRKRRRLRCRSSRGPAGGHTAARQYRDSRDGRLGPCGGARLQACAGRGSGGDGDLRDRHSAHRGARRAKGQMPKPPPPTVPKKRCASARGMESR